MASKEEVKKESPDEIEEEDEEQLNRPIVLRSIVIGDAAVGKSSLINSYTQNIKFDPAYNPTIQETYSVELKKVLGKSEQTQPNPPIHLTIVDISGSDDYEALRKITYKGLSVVVICFSIASPTSFNRVQKKWLVDREDYFSKAPFILVGLKSDLRKDNNTIEALKAKGLAPITTSQGEKLAKEIGAAVYLECSSQSVTNIKNVFDEAVTAATQSKKGFLKSIFSSHKCLNLTAPSRFCSF